jgi:hypothetical protein
MIWAISGGAAARVYRESSEWSRPSASVTVAPASRARMTPAEVSHGWLERMTMPPVYQDSGGGCGIPCSTDPVPPPPDAGGPQPYDPSGGGYICGCGNPTWTPAPQPAPRSSPPSYSPPRLPALPLVAPHGSAPPPPPSGRGYQYDWDLGLSDSKKSPEEAMTYFQAHPGQVFPFELGGCGSIQTNETCHLHTPLPWSDSPVQVTRTTDTSFTFNTLEGHFDAPGSTITFSVVDVDGRLHLIQTGVWVLPNTKQTVLSNGSALPAYYVWKQQAWKPSASLPDLQPSFIPGRTAFSSVQSSRPASLVCSRPRWSPGLC